MIRNLIINHNNTRYEFANIEPDELDRWMLIHYRDEVRRTWPILKSGGGILKRSERKPLIGELRWVIETILGRKLTGMEGDAAYQIRVDGRQEMLSDKESNQPN